MNKVRTLIGTLIFCSILAFGVLCVFDMDNYEITDLSGWQEIRNNAGFVKTVKYDATIEDIVTKTTTRGPRQRIHIYKAYVLSAPNPVPNELSKCVHPTTDIDVSDIDGTFDIGDNIEVTVTYHATSNGTTSAMYSDRRFSFSRK